MKRGVEEFAKENIRRQVPGAKDRGFFRDYIQARWLDYSRDVASDPGDEPPMTREEFFEFEYDIGGNRPDFLPDMFYIDAEKHMVYFYEIEDTNPLTADKLDRISLWILNHGDDGEWYGRLIVTDRYGLSHRMIYAYEHTLGPEPFPEEEIEFPFPRVYRRIAHFATPPENA